MTINRVDLFQFISGTTAALAAETGVPYRGEPIFDYQTGELFIGDGAAAASALVAIGGGSVATDAIWDAADDLAIGTGANTAARVAFAANTFPAKGSTGALVAKAISDAALTVLAGATVAAMVDTLGGAAATGTGALVRKTSATLETPTLGVAAVTTLNKVIVTAPATAATLTLAEGSSLITAGAFTLTLTTTGATNVTLPTSGTLATQAYADSLVIGLLDDKGPIDCSANPNYPSALKGDVYTVTVAGKIGGASGVDVDTADSIRASADNAGGTQAAVGTSWYVVEHNLVGAVLTGGALGTPSSGVATNLTGTATGLTAGTVTTNANLTGHVVSSGNATTLGAFTLAQLNAAVSDADVAVLGANVFTGLQTLSAAGLLFGSSTVASDAANILSIRNSTVAQTVHVYGTASAGPGTDYVRASLSCSTTAVTLAAQTGGTGADDIDVVLTPAGTGLVRSVAKMQADCFQVPGNSTTFLPCSFARYNDIALFMMGSGGFVFTDSTNTVNKFAITDTVARWGSSHIVGWSSAADATVALDTACSRNAAGVVEVNNGTAGTRGQIYVATTRTNQTTVANLPAASTAGAGARAFITDGATTLLLGLNTTVTGGGANKAPVYSDGTNWIYG